MAMIPHSADGFSRDQVIQLFQTRNLNNDGQGQDITYYVADVGGCVFRSVNNFNGYAIVHMLKDLRMNFQPGSIPYVNLYGVNAPTDGCANLLVEFQADYGIKINIKVVSPYYDNVQGLTTLALNPNIEVTAFTALDWRYLRMLLSSTNWPNVENVVVPMPILYDQPMQNRDAGTAARLAQIQANAVQSLSSTQGAL